MGIRVLAISKGLGSAIPVYADSSAQVDFFIHGYTKLRFLGQDVYFTTTHISMIIVILAILVFALFANRAIRKADPVTMSAHSLYSFWSVTCRGFWDLELQPQITESHFRWR